MREVMRVLVIENEPRLAARLRAGLLAEGFAVDVALTGTDGLWLARERPFGAIVLDDVLPGARSHVICRTLRAEEIWTPILVLTGDGACDEAGQLDAVADDYLAKPFTHEVLLGRLRALLRRGARERPAMLAAGDLCLDPASRRAWRGDTELELTGRELSLLELLLHRRGEVLSKREILSHVWDSDSHNDGGASGSDPGIVEVYVRRLRDKLDRPFGRAAIGTVRGAGYRMAFDGG